MSLLEILQKLTPIAAEWGVMLLPLALYFLYLAFGVLHQPRPTVLSGSINTLQLAAATSGFLLFGPITWLLSPLLAWGIVPYALGYAGYVGFLGLLLAGALQRSRRQVWILNIEPSELDDLLQQVRKQGTSLIRQGAELSFPDHQTRAGIRLEPAGSCICFDFVGPSAAARTQFTNRLRQVFRMWDRERNPLAYFYSLVGGMLLLYCLVSFLYFSWYLEHFER